MDLMNWVAWLNPLTIWQRGWRTSDPRSKPRSRETTCGIASGTTCGSHSEVEMILGSDTITWSEELYRIVGRDPTQPEPTIPEHAQLYTPRVGFITRRYPHCHGNTAGGSLRD